jgi:quercetin dioxygenase-like cupin family protein
MEAEAVRAEQRITVVRESNLAWATSGDLHLGFLASTEHLTVTRNHLRAGTTAPAEQHAGEEFVLLLSGSLTIWTPDAPDANCLHLDPGDGAVLPPETTHGYMNSGDHEAIWLCGVGPGWRSAQDIGPSL